MITVIDYGSGNIRAITNIYKRLNTPCIVAQNVETIVSATHLILPGVGAFDTSMQQLNDSGMRSALDHHVRERKTPVLGICVGMQMMAKTSEEGQLQGLGWIDANVRLFDKRRLDRKPHLPHLGWNIARPVTESILFDGIAVEEGFYFLHSYYFECHNPTDVAATTNYGIEFTSAFVADNVHGVQFHPEKSHANGIRLFKNFSELSPC